MIDAMTIHAKLGAEGWLDVLAACGIDEKFLRDRHGPCPVCGGKDRFRFDNRGRGTFFCSHCRAGDGFKLVMAFNRLNFREAFQLVAEKAGLKDSDRTERVRYEAPEEEISKPTDRVKRLLREACAIENLDAAVTYLDSRRLWPLPAGHELKAHPSVEYWQDRMLCGKHPALIAPVRDGDGDVATVHVTYLTAQGTKLANYEPRKILSPMTGRVGCAVRLAIAGDTLGIAEGIETALSATKLTGIATWAALNTSLLAKFEVPESISRLVIFADRDVAGLEAAARLMQKLQGKVTLDLQVPQAKDWNDALKETAGTGSHV